VAAGLVAPANYCVTAEPPRPAGRSHTTPPAGLGIFKRHEARRRRRSHLSSRPHWLHPERPDPPPLGIVIVSGFGYAVTFPNPVPNVLSTPDTIELSAAIPNRVAAG
jgi:hypothetical protein